MKEFASDPYIQRHGCRAVSILAKGSQTNVLELGRAGVCEIILSAMTTFRIDRYVQEYGCCAIGALANVKNTGDVIRFGAPACETVAEALKAFSSHAEVVYEACWALHKLAYDPENKEALGVLGTPRMLVNALRSFPTDAKIQEKGLSVVAEMATGNLANAGRLGDAQACEAVVEALRAFPGDKSVQEKGLMAIFDLAPTKTIREGSEPYRNVRMCFGSYQDLP